LGLNGAALLERTVDPSVKAALIEGTAAAVSAGVYGLPAFVVDGQLFFGQDRLDFLAEAIGAPAASAASPSRGGARHSRSPRSPRRRASPRIAPCACCRCPPGLVRRRWPGCRAAWSCRSTDRRRPRWPR